MPRRARAFTLIELLLVLFILAAIAATAASLGAEVEQQSRYDQTVARRELIRTAILGDPARLVDGQPVASGFVADMGRLPSNLEELLVAGTAPDWRPQPCFAAAAGPSTGWPPFLPGSFDPTGAAPTGAPQGAGWRGPYVRPDLEREGAVELRTYRDGWRTVVGAASGDPNFGWVFNPPGTPAGEVSLQSLGADGAPGAPPVAAGGHSYAADLPSDAERTLVSAADYRVDLGGLTVRVINRMTSGGVDLADVAVLVLTPEVGAAQVVWTRQRSAALGAAELPFGQLGPSRELHPDDPAAFTPAPWGRRSLVLVRAGSPLSAPKLLGPIATVTLLPRTSPPDITLELGHAP